MPLKHARTGEKEIFKRLGISQIDLFSNSKFFAEVSVDAELQNVVPWKQCQRDWKLPP
jgi:hypothetical protein